ncbi:hypothetical protein D1872_263040 [compost metagenome]
MVLIQVESGVGAKSYVPHPRRDFFDFDIACEFLFGYGFQRERNHFRRDVKNAMPLVGKLPGYLLRTLPSEMPINHREAKNIIQFASCTAAVPG